MKAILALLALSLGTAAFAGEVGEPVRISGPEVRCGWISNPTPANYWIDDAQGTWIIETQGAGGWSAKGDVPVQNDTNEKVITNVGEYGYWCGCMKVKTSSAEEERLITEIIPSRKTKAISLSKCLNDKNLPQEYRPRNLVHSTGKAFTSCVDADEEQIIFKGRSACVNQAGDYYFLAN